MAPRTLPLIVLAAGLCTTCSSKIDPNAGLFSCQTDKDCGSGDQCVKQAVRPGGLCFPIGQCKPEVCNGIDDDCDGVVDNGFDLTTDPNNCGQCGHACPGADAGATACAQSRCLETNCGNGIDDDGNGLTDCADPACLGQSCSADGGVCGTAWAPVDAGQDAGCAPDAGCGTDAGLDGGCDPDAGCVSDAGLDGGCDPDAGCFQDAGAPDAGSPDSGMPDAGVCPNGADSGCVLVPACLGG